jgi:hypothetical protein
MHAARLHGLAGPPRTELDVLRDEHGARWRCWREQLTGTYYAIRADRKVRGAYQIHAETPASLREQICRADAQDQELPIIFFGAVSTVPTGD